MESKSKRKTTKKEDTSSEKIEMTDIIDKLEKEHGKGSVLMKGYTIDLNDKGYISTGSIILNDKLGTEGLPRGRLTEIFGPESSGKTTIALSVIKEAQLNGGICSFIDVEHALDINYAENLGVKTDQLLVSQPNVGEEAFAIIETLLKSNYADVIVLDSVAALIPQDEMLGSIEDSTIGLQARLMSKALRRIIPLLGKSKCVLIFINQTRSKINTGFRMFGNMETTAGGNALRYASSVRLDIKRGISIKHGENQIGHNLHITTIKNKMSSPYQVALTACYYGEGVCMAHELLQEGIRLNIIEQAGSWFSFNEKSIGQGIEQVRQCIKNDHVLFKELKTSILKLKNNENSKNKE